MVQELKSQFTNICVIEPTAIMPTEAYWVIKPTIVRPTRIGLMTRRTYATTNQTLIGITSAPVGFMTKNSQ